jgi:cytoskeletal protein CcmA (bactofilin family)
MFKRGPVTGGLPASQERVTSILGPGINWVGDLTGSGGVRVEGTFEGKVSLRGLLVVGETGRITCENVVATTVIVAGAVRGNIVAEKLEIRSTGRVWGDVKVVALATEEGSFLRGQIQMEDNIDLTAYGLAPATAIQPPGEPPADNNESNTPQDR